MADTIDHVAAVKFAREYVADDGEVGNPHALYFSRAYLDLRRRLDEALGEPTPDESLAFADALVLRPRSSLTRHHTGPALSAFLSARKSRLAP